MARGEMWLGPDALGRMRPESPRWRPPPGLTWPTAACEIIGTQPDLPAYPGLMEAKP